VVVVGAGMTGLSLAFTLREEARRLGVAVDLRVIEAASRVGGHARTLAEDGFLVEAGPNGFLDREPETLRLIDEAGLSGRLVEARGAAKRRFILRGGRLCEVPDSPGKLVRSDALSARGKLRLLAEPFIGRSRSNEDETVFDFARRRIGAEAAEMLVDAAVSGVSAGDSRALSVRAQFPLMVEMERDHGSLVLAMLARRRRGTGPPRLMTLADGLESLPLALAARLSGAVSTGTPVEAIERVAGEWRLRLASGEILPADRVVLALPAWRAATLVSPLDAELSDRLGRIDYSGVGLVALAYPRDAVPRDLEGYGYLVTRGENLATLGCTWESSLFAGRAPEGTVLLRVFLGGARRPAAAQLEPEVAIARARSELRPVLGIQASPERAWAFSWPRAIAQYTVGHLERVENIRRRLWAHHGLEVCGTSYDGVSFNHAIACGRRHGREIAREFARSAATGCGTGRVPATPVAAASSRRVPTPTCPAATSSS
jgi:oxygen-dependent protoporphyrinogen oxidase